MTSIRRLDLAFFFFYSFLFLFSLLSSAVWAAVGSPAGKYSLLQNPPLVRLLPLGFLLVVPTGCYGNGAGMIGCAGM